jgi:hypothetical protein
MQGDCVGAWWVCRQAPVRLPSPPLPLPSSRLACVRTSTCEGSTVMCGWLWYQPTTLAGRRDGGRAGGAWARRWALAPLPLPSPLPFPPAHLVRSPVSRLSRSACATQRPICSALAGGKGEGGEEARGGGGRVVTRLAQQSQGLRKAVVR